MQMTLRSFTLIASVLMPLAALLFVAVIIWLVFRMAARQRAVLSRERMAAMERGIPLPPEAFMDSHRRRPHNSLKAGLVELGVGAGLVVALVICCPESRLWGWGLAVILIGLAHLVYWRLHGRREWEEARARELELAKSWRAGAEVSQGNGVDDSR